MDKTSNDIGMYIIDSEYRMLYINEAVRNMYPDVRVGDVCYRAVACNDCPCETCPIGKDGALFYNPVRKEWILSQAAGMDLPEHGHCNNVQFIIKDRGTVVDNQLMPENQAAKLVAQIGEAQGNECIIGGYYDSGFPLFYINHQMVELLGYDSPEEAMATVDGLLSNFVHPDDRLQVRNDLEVGNYEEGRSFETVCRLHRKDGEWLWIAAKGKLLRAEDGKLVMIAVCVDLTSVLEHQNKLQEAYENLQRKDSVVDALLNNMPGGYHRCELAEGFPLSYISDSFLNVVGWTREELQSILDNKYLNMVAPEDREYFLSLESQLMKEGRINCVYRIRRPDGGRRWVQDSTKYVEKNGERSLQCAIADITDFVEGMNDRQRKLEKAKERIEAVSKAKSAFLFNVSHDVRTPMNAIQGYTHIIEQCCGDAEMVRDMVGKIKKSSDTLMQLLNDVLELSRIESGKDNLDLSPMDLDGFVEKLYLMFDQEMEEAGIRFRLEKDIRDRFVRCDELKCTRILMNMLSNARKFTASGGTVTLGAKQLEDASGGGASYRFYVQDTGIGMSKEFQERAFEEFEREKSSTDSGIIGSGLGLAIIKRLTDLMGGTCTLESQLGKGTVISAVVRLDLDQPLEETISEPAEKTVDFSGKRILLVEDNAFNREIARFILESMGLQVEDAEHGAEALNKLQASRPGYYDLVLMDVQMPLMDGYTATREIRQLPDDALAGIPIIAMTANAFKEDRDKCLEVGMNGHLGKPIETDILAKTLAQYLK